MHCKKINCLRRVGDGRRKSDLLSRSSNDDDRVCLGGTSRGTGTGVVLFVLVILAAVVVVFLFVVFLISVFLFAVIVVVSAMVLLLVIDLVSAGHNRNIADTLNTFG